MSGISKDLKIHHIVVNYWERAVDADQNVVLISIPSVLSPDLAPLGNMCHMPICQEPNHLDSRKDLIVKVLYTKNSKLKDLRSCGGPWSVLLVQVLIVRSVK